MTGLHLAAYFGLELVIRLLLEKGADIKATDKRGQTPLYRALGSSHLEVVQLLLEKGADVEAADQDGQTPLYQALGNSYLEVVQLLLKKEDKVVANKYIDVVK